MPSTPKLPDLFFVFDGESLGLHGEVFAVGYVVVTLKGEELDSGIYVTQSKNSPGTEEDREWIKTNVLPALECDVPYKQGNKYLPNVHDVRRLFMDMWSYWKTQGAVLAADCPWPVEARFLCACIDEDRTRTSRGPYPFIDIASVRLGVGLDPLATEPRLEDESPAHNPLADARQSARQLLEALRRGAVCSNLPDNGGRALSMTYDERR